MCLQENKNGGDNVNESKKNLIRDVTAIFNKLPDNKKERAVGIMQGILLVSDETDTKENPHGCIEK